MSVELSMLMWSGVLLLVLVIITANASVMAMGMSWGFGNRSEPADLDGWSARARRTYNNHLENTVIFAVILLPISIAGISNEMTVLGAQVFLGARTVHAIVYIGGITFLAVRTMAWFAAVAGMVMVLLQGI